MQEFLRTNMHNFQGRLKEARESLGLSQQALSERLDVSLRSQQNYEAGIRQPDAAYLAALAAIGADVTYILTGQRVSEWERDVLARTAEVVSKLEPAGDGPISQKMLDAYKLTPARQKTRKNKYKDLEVMLDRCSDDDLAMVMNLASRLSAERNPA